MQPKFLLALAGSAAASVIDARQANSGATSSPTSTRASTTTTTSASTTVPDYFQITPFAFNGPTQSGILPFEAQTNTGGFGQSSYYPPDPLATHQVIANNTDNGNIFQLMGQLSHYFFNPTGFDVQEQALPAGANITWVNMLSRHGSRYPTSNSSQFVLGNTIPAYRANGTKFYGNLSFLNTWTYGLGYEVLVPVGKQEMFDSGVLHQYKYGHLWNPNNTLIIRTETQERMRQSAENFAAGFGGDINYQAQNLKIEYIIEQNGFNNSGAGYYQCNQSNTNVSSQGSTAQNQWAAIYLKDAVTRFNGWTNGTFNWTTSTVFAAQGMCPYETVALGYSAFCDLFTYQEWEGYEYGVDLSFAGNNMFQSPTGRGVGIGYVQEVLARLQNYRINTTNTQDNVTLDSMPSTFPLNQSLYFDFSHDTNIASILTAFNFTQFAPLLNQTAIQRNRTLQVSHMTPFGARLDIEVINTPRPVAANRTSAANAYAGVNSTTPTRYIHFLLNGRTLSTYPGYPECGNRTDGWCELTTWLARANKLIDAAQYAYSCFGNYPLPPYGTVSNGVPAQ